MTRNVMKHLLFTLMGLEIALGHHEPEFLEFPSLISTSSIGSVKVNLNLLKDKNVLTGIEID